MEHLIDCVIEICSSVRDIVVGNRTEKRNGCLSLLVFLSLFAVGIVVGAVAAAYHAVAFLIDLFR